MQYEIAKLIIENIGPFEKAEFCLKPFTLFIGRNASGKSFILKLLLAISAFPVLDFALDIVEDKISELFEKTVERGEKIRAENLYELVDILTNREVLKQLLERNIGLFLRRVFEVESPRELLREEVGRISLKFFSIQDVENEVNIDIFVSSDTVEVDVEYDVERLKHYVYRTLVLREIADNVFDVEVSLTGSRQVLDFRTSKEFPSSILSLLGLILGGISSYFNFLLFNAPVLTTYIIDARATVVRTRVLQAIGSGMDLNLLLSLMRQANTLDISHLRDAIKKDRLISSLLTELGVIDIEQECLEEFGLEPSARICLPRFRMWDGATLRLDKAPSGLRAAWILVLELSRLLQSRANILIEEPEAHLHPRALKLLAKLIGHAVSRKGHNVFLTTHSEQLVWYISQLIAASQVPEEIAKEYDYVDCAIEPELVAAYLVRRDDNKHVSIVEPIVVGPEGIEDREFVNILDELAQERSQLLETVRYYKTTSRNV